VNIYIYIYIYTHIDLHSIYNYIPEIEIIVWK